MDRHMDTPTGDARVRHGPGKSRRNGIRLTELATRFPDEDTARERFGSIMRPIGNMMCLEFGSTEGGGLPGPATAARESRVIESMDGGTPYNLIDAHTPPGPRSARTARRPTRAARIGRASPTAPGTTSSTSTA